MKLRPASVLRCTLVAVAALWPVVAQTQSQAVTAAAALQVPTVPNVVNSTISSAIDALAWTRLEIVQITRFTTASPPGTVVEQRPRAGTPVSAIRAETLFVAAERTDRLANAARTQIVRDRVARVANSGATTPPPAPRPDDVGGPGTTVRVSPSRDIQEVVPGIVVQQPTVVPDLYGRTSEMVETLLARSNLALGTQERGHSDSVPAGRVFRQYPAPRTQVAARSQVSVWYSVGPHPREETLVVPPVVGISLTAARDSLRRARLRIGRVDTVRRASGNGTVAHQEPRAGSTAHPGDAVDLSVLLPPITVLVPSVVGHSREAAREALRRSGLDIGRITLVVLPGVDTVVTGQTPPAGTAVEPRSLVDLVENRPPVARRVTVPDLFGLTSTQAAQRLSRDSLFLGSVAMDGEEPAATIAAQDPPAGDEVFLYSRVNVILAPANPRPDSTSGGTALPSTEPLLRVPSVVNLSAELARRTLIDSGLTRIRLAGENITGASVVDSQIPAAGTFVRSGATISLFVRAIPLRPVPNFIGLREANARAYAEADQLTLTVGAKKRALRLHDAVIVQYPAPETPTPADALVEVEVEVPVVPPAPTVIAVGLLLAAGGIVGKRPPPDTRRPLRPKPTATVAIRALATTAGAPTVAGESGSLIRAAVAFRLSLAAEPPKIETSGSLIKTETTR